MTEKNTWWPVDVVSKALTVFCFVSLKFFFSLFISRLSLSYLWSPVWPLNQTIDFPLFVAK